MYYTFDVLRTDVGPGADKYNERLLGEQTLGIEVTVPELAERCGLGNIDTQHGENTHPCGKAPIEVALIMELPPEGSTIVTVRPDRDSIGAFAVLILRALGLGERINEELVRQVGVIDGVGLREARRRDARIAQHDYDSHILALQGIAVNETEEWSEIPERVFQTAHILTGEMPEEEIQRIASARRQVDFDESDVEHLITDILVFIETEGEYYTARDWGNRHFPVVIVHDPVHQSRGSEYGPPSDKWTVISQRDTPHFDHARLAELINKHEAEARSLSVEELHRKGFSWGGRPNITSSPVGKETVLTKGQIHGLALMCVRQSD